MIESNQGTMPNHWVVVTINDLIEKQFATLQTGPFGTMLHASAYQSEGTPVIAVQHIGDNRLIHSDTPLVNEETRQRLLRYTLQDGDIIFGRKGAVDRRALVRKDEEGWLQGSDCIRLRLDPRVVNPVFVSYVLGTRSYREWIVQHAQGATMPSLNQEILRRIPLPLPSLSEQYSIADVLGSLDDKIELNRRMNNTLESLARTLFKSWFVDFDPIRAKAEKRAPVGMDAETAELFPSAFDGAIPQGWRVNEIGKAVKVVGGSTPSTKEPKYWDGGYHWATPKDLSALQSPILLDTERKITKEGVSQISSGVLPGGTLLMSSRAPVGYLAISEIPISINQGFIAMVCDSELPNYYVLNWAETNMEAIKGRANGTTFMEISKSNFRPMSVVVPTKKVIQKFIEQVEPLYKKIAANLRESHTLATLRDTLLPRLMSGEVRVKGAEVDK